MSSQPRQDSSPEKFKKDHRGSWMSNPGNFGDLVVEGNTMDPIQPLLIGTKQTTQAEKL